MRIMGSDPIVNPVANNLAQRRRGAEEVRYDRE